jgi:hypothetical protein
VCCPESNQRTEICRLKRVNLDTGDDTPAAADDDATAVDDDATVADDDATPSDASDAGG